MNWPGEVDQVHGVDQQSRLWMDIERPKPREVCTIHRIARVEGNQKGQNMQADPLLVRRFDHAAKMPGTSLFSPPRR